MEREGGNREEETGQEGGVKAGKTIGSVAAALPIHHPLPGLDPPPGVNLDLYQ